MAVAKERNWLPSGPSPDEWNGVGVQIGDYGEVVRKIRNLVHPARYAVDSPRKRITTRHLESSFEILDVTSDYLLDKIESSLREPMD
jgi:hypothetical protein